MIDWHSHILPAIDDGSHNTAESISMLQAFAKQGVDTVIATPHFYPTRESSVDAFLARRGEAEAQLREEMAKYTDRPNVICGAEVRYFPGISHTEGIEKLAIGKSPLLLLEMPFEKWTEYTVKELLNLTCDTRFTVLLAHMERYWFLQDNRTRERLLGNALRMQINASYLTRITTRRKALSMVADRSVRFIGSDAHNMTTRPPEIAKAYEIVRKKLGDEFCDHLIARGHRLLGE